MKAWKKNLVAAAVLVTVCAGIYVNANHRFYLFLGCTIHIGNPPDTQFFRNPHVKTAPDSPACKFSCFSVKPGARVPITVTLKPYRGEEFTNTVYFTVPKDHPGGKLALNVRGGSSIFSICTILTLY